MDDLTATPLSYPTMEEERAIVQQVREAALAMDRAGRDYTRSLYSDAPLADTQEAASAFGRALHDLDVLLIRLRDGRLGP